MHFIKFIKYLLFFFLTFLFGTQTTCAKTDFVLPQNQASFSIEQNDSFKSLEKVFQPNIGFLIEKTKLGASESVSSQNQHEFSEYNYYNLGKAGGVVYKDFSKTINFGTDILKTPGKKYNILGRAYPKDGSLGSKELYDELIAKGVPESEVTGLFQQVSTEWKTLPVLGENGQQSKYWFTYNKPHIDNIIANGGEIRFIHDPRLPVNKHNLVSEMPNTPFKQKCIDEGITKLKTFMRQEYEYLLDKVYTLQENGLMIKL
jgi:hypothetical protein